MKTYGWEITQCEDAQQTGLSTSSIANDNELSANQLVFGARLSSCVGICRIFLMRIIDACL